MGLTIPKNHKTLLKIISNTRSSHNKKKIKKKKKKKRIEEWKKGYKFASGFRIWSASAPASSLFVEKLWKETVICLKTVEEKIEGERGRGRRGNTKAKRIEGKSHRVWSLIMWCGLRKCVNFDHDAWGNVWVGLGFSWDLISHNFFFFSFYPTHATTNLLRFKFIIF